MGFVGNVGGTPVIDKKDSKDVYHFQEFGENFILKLLKNIGCDASLC